MEAKQILGSFCKKKRSPGERILQLWTRYAYNASLLSLQSSLSSCVHLAALFFSSESFTALDKWQC